MKKCKFLFISLITILLYSNCVAGSESAENKSGDSKINKEVLKQSIVESSNKRTSLVKQNFKNIDAIYVDSLTLLKDWAQPYSGYLTTRWKNGNFIKTIYVEITDITVTEEFISWKTLWDSIPEVALDEIINIESSKTSPINEVDDRFHVTWD